MLASVIPVRERYPFACSADIRSSPRYLFSTSTNQPILNHSRCARAFAMDPQGHRFDTATLFLFERAALRNEPLPPPTIATRHSTELCIVIEEGVVDFSCGDAAVAKANPAGQLM